MQPVESMDLSGVREAIAWAEREGWEPGRDDAEAFYAADPGGFFRTTIDGETAAMISVVQASPSVAFVGFYMVAPERRGTGWGKALWDQALARVNVPTLGLDAVLEQVDTYASEGFEPAYGAVRYETDRRLGPPSGSHELTPASELDFEALTAFDARHFFGPRPDFLRRWIKGPGRKALAAKSPGGEITGLIASRQTAVGNRIGPVFAEDADTAREMVLGLASQIEGRIALDVPLANASAVDAAEALGMTRGFEARRMYRGPAPELPLPRIFGTTSLELG